MLDKNLELTKEKEYQLEVINNNYVTYISDCINALTINNDKNKLIEYAKIELNIDSHNLFQITNTLYNSNNDITKEEMKTELLRYISQKHKSKFVRKIANELLEAN